MKTLDYLQLDPKKTEKTIDSLQKLLANLQLYYTNLRGYHWNVKGINFFGAHEKYEEYYDDTADKVDEVAERILMLGGTPAHNFSDYLKTADIKETGVESNVKEIAKQLLGQLKVLLELEREILDLADDANDEGTADLVTGFITDQEKVIWMLTALLS